MERNIQFMTETKTRTDLWGQEEVVYIPDFDELIANACCQEEIDMLERTRKFYADHPQYEGFTFQICYTSYEWGFDMVDGKQVFKNKWQLMQQPWYIEDGEKVSKEEMIKIIKSH